MKNATLAQGNQMLNLILQKQTSSEQLQELLKSGLFSDLLEANFENYIDRDAFRRLVGLKPINTFTINVNYDLPLEEMVKAGKYDWVNREITTDKFPSKRKGTAVIDVDLIFFNRDMEWDEVLLALDKMGYRPAELPELLAFGAKYPDIQKNFPIVAFGSVGHNSEGHNIVVGLFSDYGGRGLRLYWLDSRWRANYRFAVLRE
jgi:hypothetical protein